MKTKILMLLLSGSLSAQFRLADTEYFTTAVVVDPNASIKENGLNIGAEVEYAGKIYARASVTLFFSLIVWGIVEFYNFAASL